MSSEDQQKPGRSAWRVIRNQFIAGLIVIAPLAITIFIIWWLFTTADNLLQPVVVSIVGHRIPGVGFAAIVVIILLAGIITGNLVGKRMLRWAENYFVSRIPLVRQIYGGVKQVSESFSVPGKSTFLGVVLVNFPHKETKTIGFITNIRTDESGEIVYHIFVPTVPNPTNGFLFIMKENEFTRTKITPEDAIKMVVSVGKFSPK